MVLFYHIQYFFGNFVDGHIQINLGLLMFGGYITVVIDDGNS